MHSEHQSCGSDKSNTRQVCERSFPLMLALVSGLAACQKRVPKLAWSDLFLAGQPVDLVQDAANQLRTDTILDQAGPLLARDRLLEDLGPDVSVSALRAGRFERKSGAREEYARLGSLARYSREQGAAFLPRPRSLDETPYWVGLDYHQVSAVMGNRIVVASNLFYPIYVYNAPGRAIDSLTTPPPSWRDLRRPQPGEFAMSQGLAGREAFRAWLQSFTVIMDMAVVANSVLIVNHGAYRPDAGGALRLTPTVSDVYLNGVRAATDVPSPGEVLAYSKRAVYVLTGTPQAPHSQVTEHMWRGSANRH